MKVLKYTGLFLLLAIVLFVLWYSPSYVYRVFVWQDADYDDYTRFSTSPMTAASSPSSFAEGSEMQSDRVSENFNRILKRGTLDSLLEAQATYAFLVIQKDSLLYEKYAGGIGRKTIQTSFSTAKSILNLLVGSAIERGDIKSVNEPITEYLPELSERDRRFEKIRIDDLLRMRSGLAYKPGVSFPIVTSDDPLTYLHPDLRKVALENTRIQSEPDIAFRYNNYNALLLGLILERATGMSVSAFTRESLVEPLGFEYDSFWSTDENGFEKMESGLNARPIDFAKIGRLMLQSRSSKSELNLPPYWYRESTAAKDTLVFKSGHQWGYGRMWWMVINDSVPPHPFANGRFGQFIYVCPVSDMVIVRHGLSPDSWDDNDWTTLFFSYCSTFHK